MYPYSIDMELNAKYRRINKIPNKERSRIIELVNKIKIIGITDLMEYFYLNRLRVIYNNLNLKFLELDKGDIIDTI